MRNIAIIPARSGSKGLKDKNIKLLHGQPLMAYTIEAAKQSSMFEEIFVSTDKPEYAEIARQCGASVPFLRRQELATDTASSWAVVAEALRRYEARGQHFDTFALLQPTSPLRTSEDIIAGYQLMAQKKAKAIVGVCEVEHSPLWCNTLGADGSMDKFGRQSGHSLPRQSLPTYYRINGALYLVRVDSFRAEADIYSDACYAYIMQREHSIDIDTELDFLIAHTLKTQGTQGDGSSVLLK